MKTVSLSLQQRVKMCAVLIELAKASMPILSVSEITIIGLVGFVVSDATIVTIYSEYSLIRCNLFSKNMVD